MTPDLLSVVEKMVEALEYYREGNNLEFSSFKSCYVHKNNQGDVE